MEDNIEKVNSNSEQMVTSQQMENNDEKNKDKVKQESKLFDHFKNKPQVQVF